MDTVFGCQPATNKTGPVDASAKRGGHPALPCLSSNNSDGVDLPSINRLTGGHKRTAFILAFEIGQMAKKFGIEKLGFFTLTFADNVTCIREAQRRFNNLNRRVLKARYDRAIGVWERQASRRIHFHLVVLLKDDIRTGFSFDDLRTQQGRARYRSASGPLRREWSFWRSTAPRYGFGRTELLPVKSTADGIARYVGGYVKKHTEKRLTDDKGARVVRYIGFKPGDRRGNTRFAWNSTGGWMWRMKLKSFAALHGVKDTDQLKAHYGHRWAYKLQEAIFACPLPDSIVYPSMGALNAEQTCRINRYKRERVVEERNRKEGRGENVVVELVAKRDEPSALRTTQPPRPHIPTHEVLR